MAVKKKSKRARPGFEPAMGRPDPTERRPSSEETAGITHMPHRNGAVCGRKETSASAYTVERPSCAKCRAYYDSVQRLSRPAPTLHAPPEQR